MERRSGANDGIVLRNKNGNILCSHRICDNCNINMHDKGTHNVDISENVQGAETAHRVDDEAAGRKRTGTK